MKGQPFRQRRGFLRLKPGLLRPHLSDVAEGALAEVVAFSKTPWEALVLSIFSTVMPLVWTLVLLLIILYSFRVSAAQL